MIIVCPTCSSKYSVQESAINGEKMVRCPLCGTTWQPESDIVQNASTEQAINTISRQINLPKDFSLVRRPKDLSTSRHWMFFFAVVFSTLTFLTLKTNYIHRIPVYIKFVANYIKHGSQKSQITLDNVSHYFIKRDDGVYLSITGDIINISPTSIPTPYLSVNLRTYGEEFANYGTPDMFINETWAIKLDIKNIASNQKVVFETEPKKIPLNNLMCTIKVGKNF